MAFLTRLTILFACAFNLSLMASEGENGDHPLVTRYPGSTIYKQLQNEFDTYQLTTGFDDKKRRTTDLTLEGKITRTIYMNPEGRSTLEIIRNYENALRKAGMELIFQCEGRQCSYAIGKREKWAKRVGVFYLYEDNRYMAGKLRTDQGETYVALMVTPKHTVLDIIELKSMQDGLVTVNAEALEAGLARDGKVSIYGIYFDTGQAVVKPESKPTLDEIARLLKNKPQLKLYVVGHTDNTGAFDMNMRLSSARAKAVVGALVKNYGIAGARLAAYGVGPLAPASTNTTDNGRGQNRRVELVAQ